MKTRALCVSIHDVAPRTWAACRQIVEAVQCIDASLPLTLLIVPRYHGDPHVPAEYARWIEERIAHGDELVLHGYTHRDEAAASRTWSARLQRQTYTACEGEFAALTRDEAAERIEKGRRWFAEQGWPVAGFVAPAWLVSPGAWDALRDADFLYTTTLTRFHLLERNCSMLAPSVVYSTRSAWRRAASLLWNAALAGVTRRMPLLRVGFHPADAAYPEIMRQALALIAQLKQDRTPLTKSAFARSAESG